MFMSVTLIETQLTLDIWSSTMQEQKAVDYQRRVPNGLPF